MDRQAYLDQIESMIRGLDQDGYEITDEHTRGWEFYFIRHELDQNRVKDVDRLEITLYKKSEDGQFLGSATGEIPEGLGRDEILKALQDLLFQATLVRNPVYSLNQPDSCAPAPQESEPIDLAEIAGSYIRAMKQVPETAAEDINSYEIFVNELTTTFRNSEGIRIRSRRPSSMIEVVANARRDGHEIELYRNYKSGTCDSDKLVRDLTETLRCGRDKLEAGPTPKLGTATVILSTEAAVSLYEYFLYQMHAMLKLRGLSTWELDRPIAEDVIGDRITIRAVTELPNSSENRLFDEEGARITDKYLLTGNIPRSFWGPRQFSQYLGLEESFIVHNFVVSGGSRSAADLRKGDYLELLEFSDFQADPMTGDIAGEIRLGYWHHDGKVDVVSGGSVSGSLKDYLKEMYISEETVQYNSAVIPAVTRLQNVTITGVKDPD
ncbi:MAG: TldD/PmbA family protein [Firmicutes bacterium]|nr:TldD/PmbA family protein [Bacillota bacterium]